MNIDLGDVQVLPDAEPQKSLLGADGQSVVWPTPRSPKIDVATVLQKMINEVYGLNIEIIINGAFHQSMMRDEKFNSRSVIVVQRSGDQAQREGLGELTGVFTFKDVQTGKIIDAGSVLPDPSTIAMKDQISDEIVDIWLFDENDQRLEQLYLLIKTIMFAAEKTFTEVLGYVECIRLNGQDSVSLNQVSGGGIYFVFERALQYRMRHMDFITGIEDVVNLIKQTYTVTDSSGNATTATESTDL